MKQNIQYEPLDPSSKQRCPSYAPNKKYFMILTVLSPAFHEAFEVGIWKRDDYKDQKEGKQKGTKECRWIRQRGHTRIDMSTSVELIFAESVSKPGRTDISTIME